MHSTTCPVFQILYLKKKLGMRVMTFRQVLMNRLLVKSGAQTGNLETVGHLELTASLQNS